ncbi:hypothetical protein [uncultured Lutibacter sp.]|uniref:hypothetical protein n=1 Tax=uncultured Lutibacter sp. TaxID=437739 RepID=UPI002614DB19|nr:hypothetical protein [uncultured Lutibacter sp.]
MKKNIIYILTFISCYISFSQVILSEKDENLFKEIPQEKIFLHFNSSFLLAGENLYYKIYCLNAQNNKLSSLSKIAYVEFVDSNLEVIFKQKIKLISGLGQGDFFIPSSILSGNYKIVAYTQWMRNAGELNIFQNDISIVNPFNENQDAIINKTVDTLLANKKGKINYNKNDFIIAPKEFFELKLNKKNFKSREKIILKFTNNKNLGNYSLSVRKVTPFEIPKRYNSVDAIKNNIDFKKNTPKSIFLPELRGELIFGTVYERDSNLPAADVKVTLTITGNDKLFKIANTNNLGRFYFNISENYEQSNAIIQVLNKYKNYKLNIENLPIKMYDYLSFSNFKINELANEFILKQSIYNQIENAYKEVKLTKINQVEPELPFYNKIGKTYDLDDFTRFPTIKETIIEVVDAVTIKSRNGKSLLDIIWENKMDKSGLLPLVIFDGIIIENHNEFLNFNARKVKKIHVVREKYLYGTQLFEGVISFESIKGDINGFNSERKDYIVNIDLLKPLEKKSYFKQVYDKNKFEHIPDYRNQLLWMPNLSLSSKDEEVIFYTSDNKGEFEICIEGFTESGKPVSLREIINVE